MTYVMAVVTASQVEHKLQSIRLSNMQRLAASICRGQTARSAWAAAEQCSKTQARQDQLSSSRAFATLQDLREQVRWLHLSHRSGHNGITERLPTLQEGAVNDLFTEARYDLEDARVSPCSWRQVLDHLVFFNSDEAPLINNSALSCWHPAASQRSQSGHGLAWKL